MNKNLKRYLSLFLILTIFTFSLSGCYNTHNIDRLAYVVALGIDVGTHNTLKLSFQISIPGGKSEGNSSQTDTSIVNSIECDSIDSGINLMDSYLSREINLAHCKVIVFSEEFAYNGISESLYTLINKLEVRPTSNVVVCRSSAEYFLNNSKPLLEKLSARYYEVAPSSSEYTGYTEDVTLSRMFSDYKDSFKQCYAILGGVNNPSVYIDSGEDPSEQDASYKADETLITDEPNIENMGLAIFSGDSLVGELNGIETICHQIISDKLHTCIISIPSPFEKDDYISLRLRQTKNTKVKVKFVNGSPYITSDVYIEARILSMDKGAKYLDHDSIEKLEKYANSYLKDHLYNYLYKISKVYNSDIDGFGRYAASQFLTWSDWTSYNWLDNFHNSFFQVNVTTIVKSGYNFMET